MSHFTRRNFLKSVGISAGALIGTKLAGRGSLIGEARALATVPNSSVVMIHMNGGFNAIFSGADAFTNTAFSVTGGNVMTMGPVVIDNTLGNLIPQNLRTMVASVGIRHGNTDHDG